MSFTSISQNRLSITSERFGKIKRYEFFEGDILNYKIKGNKRFLTSRLVAMQDSNLVFESEDAIKLNQLTLIRVKKKNFHNKLFQKIFIRGAVGYPLLMMTNNVINGVNPLLNERAAIVSGSFLVGILILRKLDTKRIRINDRKVVKVTSINYQHLGNDK
jgi:hypothetical protein